VLAAVLGRAGAVGRTGMSTRKRRLACWLTDFMFFRPCWCRKQNPAEMIGGPLPAMVQLCAHPLSCTRCRGRSVTSKSPSEISPTPIPRHSTTPRREQLLTDAYDGPERRSLPRRSSDSTIIFTIGLSEVVVGQLRDISLSGVGILSAQQVPVGSSIGVRIPASKDKVAKQVAAEIRHATMQKDGRWLLGCRMLRRFTFEEVSALMK
jgi:hypothetical protein